MSRLGPEFRFKVSGKQKDLAALVGRSDAKGFSMVRAPAAMSLLISSFETVKLESSVGLAGYLLGFGHATAHVYPPDYALRLVFAKTPSSA